jgi:hypothetical protein
MLNTDIIGPTNEEVFSFYQWKNYTGEIGSLVAVAGNGLF